MNEVHIISNKRGRLIIKQSHFKFEKQHEYENFIVLCPSVIQNRIYLEYDITNKCIEIKTL